MKKKFISTVLAILGITIIGYSILYFLGLFKEQEAGLLIETSPVSQVFVNGDLVGITPYETKVTPSEMYIKIKPNQVNDNVLDDYETKVRLVAGVKTIIKRNFEPDEDASSGETLSFEKIGGLESHITVASLPDKAQVIIDDQVYGYTPLKLKIPAGNHNLVVQSEGYSNKKLSLKVYRGYNLTTLVKLAKSDDKVNVYNDEVVNSLQNLGRVRVDKNSVGFLRVRSGANTGFPEVAKILPNEEYDILEEGENGSWYKIKVGEIEGWVNSEFVTKISS